MQTGTERRLPPNAGKGRKKGVPNKITADVRAAIASLLEASAPKFQGWLDSVAADDPARALDLVVKLSEYHIPKLGRSEVTGLDGGDILVKVMRFGQEA